MILNLAQFDRKRKVPASVVTHVRLSQAQYRWLRSQGRATDVLRRLVEAEMSRPEHQYDVLKGRPT